MIQEERDINDIFDDALLTEERFRKQGYNEGYVEGRVQANEESYKLGYERGVKLGKELGEIYGNVVAHLQLQQTEKVRTVLLQLQQSIDAFPRFNDPECDIVGELEQIRSLNKRIRVMLYSQQPSAKSTSAITQKTILKKSEDYSF